MEKKYQGPVIYGVAHSLAKATILVVEPIFWKEVGPPWLENLILEESLH